MTSYNSDPLSSPSKPRSFWAWLRFPLRKKKSNLHQELEQLIEGHDNPIEISISAGEKAMLTNILNLRHKTVRDVMVPRANIIGVELSASFEEIHDLIKEYGHSRYPIYRKNLDDPIGFFHIKDATSFLIGDQDFVLSPLIRSILFVAPSAPIGEVLLLMQSSKKHMALVIDEFGGTDGLITIEDLVEEIVGEINDEFDKNTEDFLRLSAHLAMVNAHFDLDLLEEEIGRFLTDDEREDDVDTIGGLLTFLIDRVPQKGEIIEHSSGLQFEIVEADPRRITKVRIHKLNHLQEAFNTEKSKK